jgi:hypothetical protein
LKRIDKEATSTRLADEGSRTAEQSSEFHIATPKLQINAIILQEIKMRIKINK